MNNYEWLKSLNIEDMARAIPTTDCEFCIYRNVENCDDKCEEGIRAWLSKKHDNPIPEIRIGDIIYVRIGGHFEKLAVINDIYANNLHNMTVRWRELDNIWRIARINENGIIEIIWRADNDK